jgi:muconolactone delta-isomerase
MRACTSGRTVPPVAHKEERTFLVESYVPQLDEQTATAMTSRLEAAGGQLQREGTALRLLRSFALVGEETYLCLVAASDLDDVARLNRRAGLEYDHVVEVVAIEPFAQPDQCVRRGGSA